MYSSHTVILSTQYMQITSCSMLLASVLSSAVTVVSIFSCHLLYHAALSEPWFVAFHSEHSDSYACHKTFQSTFEALRLQLREELLEIWLLILLALMKSNALAGKIGYTLDNFKEAVPIFLLLTLEPLLQLLINVTCWVNIITACLHSELSYLWKLLVFLIAFFQFLNPSDKKELSNLVSRWSSPFKFAVTRVANYRIWR